MLRSYRQSLIATNPAFRNLFLGQAISQIGDALYYVSFMFMVEKLTGSLAMVGIVGAAEMLPFLIFGPYSGVLADRVDRRKILFLTDIASAIILMMLAMLALISYPVPGWTLVLTGFLTSSVRTFFFPAKNASIPRLVEPKDLQAAFALSMGTQNLMMLMGTAFAATVMASLYAQFPQQTFFIILLTLNSCSFLGSAYFIAKLPPIVPERSANEQHAMKEFAEGLRYMKKRYDLLTMMGVSLLFGLAVAPFFVMFVAANKQWFGGQPQTLAWCEFSFFGGMVIGSYAVGRMPSKRPGISFIVGAAIVGVGVLFMAFSRNFYLFCWWNLVCGIAVPFIDVPKQSYLQSTVPDAFRGRVNSVLTMTNTAVMPIGMAGAGALLKRFGLVFMFLLMGSFMTVASLLGLLGKDFREARMPEAVTETEEEPELILEDGLKEAGSAA